MLSNSSKYALKAVLYLTLHTDDHTKMQVKEISENLDVPKAYTGKLLQSLAKSNIISSARGPKGGFYVNQANKDQSIMSVIDLIDGRKKMESCILGLSDCDLDRPCPLHNLIVVSRSKIIKVFEDITLAELAESLKDKKTFLPQ